MAVLHSSGNIGRAETNHGGITEADTAMIFLLLTLHDARQNIGDREHAELAGIENQVIIPACAPVHAGVIIIVPAAETVALVHGRICLIRLDTVDLDGALDTERGIRSDEHAEQVGVIAEDIVGAASDEDRRLMLICKLLDDLALREENIVLWDSLRLVHIGCFCGGVGAGDRNVEQEGVVLVG